MKDTPSPFRLDRANAMRFVRFLAVGLVNMAFGYSVFAVLVLIGLGPELALALSFIIGVLWNYFTTARFVFQVQGYGRLVGFAVTYVGIYVFNVICLKAAMAAGLSSLLAQALLTPPVSVLTFIILSFVMRDGSKNSQT